MNTWKNKVQGIVQKCWGVGEGCQRGYIQHATVSAGLYFPVDFGGPGGSLTYPIPGWRKCEVSALRVLKQVYSQWRQLRITACLGISSGRALRTAKHSFHPQKAP